MPVERFYSPEPLALGERCTLEGQELHHLAHVVRCRPGEQVEIVNGKGRVAQAVLEEVGRQSASLHITQCTSLSPPPELILAQAIPRMNRLEWIVEKGTELGASGFWLFPGEWSEREQLSCNQKARLHHLAIAAMKQCGRGYLPSIICMPRISGWPEQKMPILFGDTRASAPQPKLPLPKPLILLVGPERGLSPTEQQLLEDHLHAQGIRLHANTLRTETAALALLVLASY